MAPRIVSPLLQVIADAVSSPLIIVGNTGAGGTFVQAGGAFVEAANDLAVQLLRPDSNGHLERDDSKGLRSSLLRMPLADLLEVVGGQLEAGCIADCTTCLPSGATVAVKCDCRRCDLPEHPNLLFVNLMPGISEPDAFEDEDEQQVEEEEAVVLNQVKIQKLNILLVEDDAFSASVISELCRSCDFRVTWAGGGEESLQLLRENVGMPPSEQFNLVLCDVMMHGMNGMQVLEHIRLEHGDGITVIMMSSNDQHEMVQNCILRGADSYLFKPLRRTDFSHIWQFVMQQQTRKLRIKQSSLKAERSELKYQRWQQFAEMQRMQAEKQRAVAMAQVEQERARREQAQANEERQRAGMQKRMMWLLHQQVQRYWLLAKMCNDVIVHATTSGLFLYLSPKCKALLGYEPEQLTEEKLPSCVHPDDLRGLRDMLQARKQASSPRADGEGPPTLSQRNANAAAADVAGLLVSLRFRAHDNSYVTLELPMHMVTDQSGDGAAGMIGAMPQLTLQGGQYRTLSGGVRSQDTSPHEGSPLLERRGVEDELETPPRTDTDAAAEAGGKRRGGGDGGGAGGGDGGGDGGGEGGGSAARGAAGGAAGAIGAPPTAGDLRREAPRLGPPRLGERSLNPGSSQSLSRLLAEAFSAINGEAASSEADSPAGASALGSAPPLAFSFPPTRPTPPASRHVLRASRSSRSANDVTSHAWSPDDAQMSAWLLQARRAAEEAKTARGGAARRGDGTGDGDDDGAASAAAPATEAEAEAVASQSGGARSLGSAASQSSGGGRGSRRSGRGAGGRPRLFAATDAGEYIPGSGAAMGPALQIDEGSLEKLEREERAAAARANVMLCEHMAADALSRFFSLSTEAEFEAAAAAVPWPQDEDSAAEASPDQAAPPATDAPEGRDAGGVSGLAAATGAMQLSPSGPPGGQPEAPPAEAEPSSEDDQGGDGAGTMLVEEGGVATNEVGTLKLRVMRTFFIARKQSEFTLLGATVYFGEPTAKRTATVRRLLDTGASVENGGSCGWQPLNLALTGGDANIEVILLLLAHGADVESMPRSLPHQTPLLLAASCRQEAAVLALLEARASLHARNKDGEFALALCAEWTPDSRAKRMCAALLARGADPTVRCVDGSTAERRATRVGNLATVALLREHAEAAAELAQRQLMMEEDADGDTLGSLSGSSSRKSGRKGGQRSHGRSGRW